MAKKVQLNNEQWAKLRTLHEACAVQIATSAIKVTGRLNSHGFLALDPHGREYLTERGIYRIGQGR